MKDLLIRVRTQSPRQVDAMPPITPIRKPYFSITKTHGKFAGRYSAINEYDIKLTINGLIPYTYQKQHTSY